MKTYYSNSYEFFYLSPFTGENEREAVRSVQHELFQIMQEFDMPQNEEAMDEFMSRVRKTLYEVKICKACKLHVSIDEFCFDKEGQICDNCVEELRERENDNR